MTKSRTPFSQRTLMWHGHFGVGLIDCQAQRALTLIGQRWSTISASTRYPRLNPLWLVTHCTLSHGNHSFQSHMYHLACMEMAKFLCEIFNWSKLFYCNGVTSPKPLSLSKFLWCCFLAQMAKIAKIIRYFVGTSQVIIIQISDWRAIFYMLKYQWKTTQSADFKWNDDLYLWGHGYNMENK